MKHLFLSLSLMLILSACTVHEAAVIGAIPGRMVGIPLGMAITAVDESFKTATDVVKANPRYSSANNTHYSQATKYYPPKADRKYNNYLDGDYHYYKAEVLIKTQGSAQIESLHLLESKNVTDFWQ